jgi:hypothetical protein
MDQGLPVQGTWNTGFEKVDLLEIRRPFSMPLPGWIRNYRIKEWECFSVQDDRFHLEVILGNMKYFCIAQVYLVDLESRERLQFCKLDPLGNWKLPKDLSNFSVNSRLYGFFFRIHHWLDAGVIKMDLDIEATRKRPSFTAHLEFDVGRQLGAPLVVNLLFSPRRNMYVYKNLAPVRGDMVFGGRHIALSLEKTSGIFRDYKGFFPYRMDSVWCTACGFDAENRRYGFSIGENPTRETYVNNENVLWTENGICYLPPVRITCPEGVDSDGVIQDLEGMVDLTFTPQERAPMGFNFFMARANYQIPLGIYNGSFVDSSGKKITVHNLWGTGEDIFLRI